MKKVYIVSGGTGEYSDRCDWNIAAYLDKTKAEEHVSKLKELTQDLKRICFYDMNNKSEYKEILELDPYCQCDYTGMAYGIEELNLCNSVDEFKKYTINKG